jgi:cation transport ATPase
MHLSENNVLTKCWNFINLMVGNSRRFNCKQPGYRKKLTLSIMTVYLSAFTFGLFAGDITSSAVVEVENIFGILSTIAVYSLGFSVLYNCWLTSSKGHRGSFPSLVSLAMIGSQTAVVFNIFPPPVENMFYYFASSITMLFVYSLVHKNKHLDHEKHNESGFVRIRND